MNVGVYLRVFLNKFRRISIKGVLESRVIPIVNGS